MDKKDVAKKMKENQNGRIIAVARHGSTDSNGDEVFRGWKEVPHNQLSDKGKHDAEKLGEKIKAMAGNSPKDYVIVYSDLNRARNSAEIASHVSGVPCGKSYKDLRSQDTGDFSGVKESKVKPIVIEMTDEHPDKPLPGAKESHLDFIKRIKKAFREIPKDYPNKKIIVLTHHQVEVLQKNNFNPADEVMFKNGIEPGRLRKV